NSKESSLQGFAAALAVSLPRMASQSRTTRKSETDIDTSLIHIESRKSPTKSLFDVGSRRISIFTVNAPTKEYTLMSGLDDGVAASFQRSRIHKPHALTHVFKVNRSTSRSLILNFPTIKEPKSEIKNTQVDQGSQIKMMQVKEMKQDNDLKNSKSKDKGSRSRSQSMNE
ncbi:hypothetical protein Tco_1235151, partial [Tanacetum coccineum]